MASAELIVKFTCPDNTSFWGDTAETQADYQACLDLAFAYWGDRLSIVQMSATERQVKFTIFDDNPHEIETWTGKSSIESADTLAVFFSLWNSYCLLHSISVECNCVPWGNEELFVPAAETKWYPMD